MKAMVYRSYGTPEVLALTEVERPRVGDRDVLIRTHAASVTAGDWRLLRGDPFLVRLMFGLRRPRHPVLGADVAGRVKAVGREVSDLRPGDAVFGDLSNDGFGAFAEYVRASRDAVVAKPANVSWEQAAAVPVSAVTALQGLRDHGQLQPGQSVLINGASGGVGSFAVQIAKALGAEVTGVASGRKLDLVRALGADHVVDYRQHDVTRSGQRFDLILDTAAYRSLGDHRRALRPGGAYVMVGGPVRRMFEVMLLGPWLGKRWGIRIRAMLAKPNAHDLRYVGELLARGQIVPAIDRRFALSELGDALGYLGSGRARGKVVVTFGASAS